MPKQEPITRVVGTVAGVNPDRGFFFICGPDGRDYFAMVRDLPDHRSPNTLIPRKTRIEFTPEERVKGPAAINLRIVPEEEEEDACDSQSQFLR